MSNVEKVHEMAQRVGLPYKVAQEIYFMALNCALKLGKPKADMVLVAQAISYAAKNKHRLKPRWQS